MTERIFEFARRGLPYHLAVVGTSNNITSDIINLKQDNKKSSKTIESKITNKSRNETSSCSENDASVSQKLLPTLSVCNTILNCFSIPYTHCTSEASSENNHTLMFPPTLPIHIIRPNKNLEICFDTRTRNAVYVQHRIVADEYYKASGSSSSDDDDQRTVEQTDYDIHNDEDNDDKLDMKKGSDNKGSRNRRRRYRFKEEVIVPEVYRSRNSHYHNSGYDRGHLAPAADFKNLSNKNVLDYVEQTYNLCNVSPQNQDMNRKIWSYLESWVRNVTRLEHENEKKRTGKTTSNIVSYVTTGPLWLPKQKISDKLFQYQYNAIGNPPSLVQVPTHFYKIVLLVKVAPTISSNNDNKALDDKIQIRKFACFVIPNDSSSAGKSIGDYLVPWTDLEAVTGLVFYPQLVTDQMKYTADTLTGQVKTSIPNSQNQSTSTTNHPEPIQQLTEGTNINRQSSSSGTTTAMTRFFHRGKNNNNDASLVHMCQNYTCIRPRKGGGGL